MGENRRGKQTLTSNERGDEIKLFAKLSYFLVRPKARTAPRRGEERRGEESERARVLLLPVLMMMLAVNSAAPFD